MFDPSSLPALPRVGHQVINKEDLPVYELPTGHYVCQRDKGTGDLLFVSVDGAKTLKNGQYPLTGALQSIRDRMVEDEVPLALQSDEDQEAVAAEMLRAFVDRLIDLKIPFACSEN